MTEKQWLASDDPEALLKYVAERLSARKFRLTLCGCLRAPEVWALLTGPASRRAVEVAEAFVEGAATLQQLGQARTNANAAANRAWRKAHAYCPAASLANRVCWQDGNLSAYTHPSSADQQIGRLYAHLGRLPALAGLSRDVLGNPFRPPTDPSAWLAPSVVSIAQAAYEERALPPGELDAARLAVLADALEEAGCTDADILSHLRSFGPHVRGCWALDLILGKS
jgi:hypothetical protein